MDCRRSLLALSLAWACCGCIWSQNQQQRPTPPTTVDNLPPNAVKEPDPPKRVPKASTVVAFGACKESEANKADIAPMLQRELRDHARKAYQDALQIDPNYLPAYAGLARVYRDMGDCDRAMDIYRRGLERHPREVGLWVDMAMCQARCKDFNGAIQTLQRAVSLDPENRRALKTLGFCLARAGRTEESVMYLARTLGEAEAHLQVAKMVLHLHANNALPPAAAHNLCGRHLEMALRYDPNLSPARELLAQLATGGETLPAAQLSFEGL